MRILETTSDNNSKLNSDFVTIRPASWTAAAGTKDVSHLQTAEQCIKKSSLDFSVEKTPCIVNLPGRSVVDKDGNVLFTAGNQITSTKQFATVRTDQTGEDAILGYVGKGYEVLQNSEAFGFMDSLVGDGFAIFDKAGSFRNGSRIFITADLPDHLSIEVAPGDTIRPKLLLTHAHDGKGAITVCFTYVRIWCENTLNFAIKSAVGNKLTLRHTLNMKDKLATAHQILGISDLYKQELETVYLPKVTQRETKNKEWEYIVAAAVASKPEHVTAYLKGDRDTKKVPFQLVNTIDAIKQYDNLNPTQQSLGNTAWGAYNAITGYFQNVESVDEVSNGDKLASTLDGRISKISQAGWDAAVTVAETPNFLKKFNLN